MNVCDVVKSVGWYPLIDPLRSSVLNSYHSLIIRMFFYFPVCLFLFLMNLLLLSEIDFELCFYLFHLDQGLNVLYLDLRLQGITLSGKFRCTED